MLGLWGLKKGESGRIREGVGEVQVVEKGLPSIFPNSKFIRFLPEVQRKGRAVLAFFA